MKNFDYASAKTNNIKDALMDRNSEKEGLNAFISKICWRTNIVTEYNNLKHEGYVDDALAKFYAYTMYKYQRNKIIYN